MRVVFMGTPEFAVPSLKALLQSSYQVIGVMTQPDRPKGRGKVITPPPVKKVAQEHGLPIIQPVKMKDPAFHDHIRQWQPDLIAVAAFGRILPKTILDLPPMGCVNVHGSLLPRYRGAAPIQWAIINGDAETGITTMLMDEGMDTGDILLQEGVPIRDDDTAGTLSERLAVVGGELLIQTLKGLEARTLVPRPQVNDQATLAPILKKEEGNLDWTQDAEHIANRIRGLSPWPGCYTYLGKERLTIWGAHRVPPPETCGLERSAPGTVISGGKGEMLVATGQGILAISELQPENRKRMPVKQFLVGRHIEKGIQLRREPLAT